MKRKTSNIPKGEEKVIKIINFYELKINELILFIKKEGLLEKWEEEQLKKYEGVN